MMDYFAVEGGRPLEGRVFVHGAKNSVLPVLADSGRMTLANLLPTVGNLAFLAWFPLLAKAAPAWFVYLLPLWLLIGGAGSALGMASLMRPAFAQLEKAGRKEEEPEEEPDTEDSVQ